MTLRMNYDLIPTLAEICDLSCDLYKCEGTSLLKKGTRENVMTEWINGIADIARQPIKYGIRNEHYSITIEGCTHQFFESHRIISIYNLQKDPDELNNLVETMVYGEYNVKEISELLLQIKQRYLKISIDYFEGKYLCSQSGDYRIAELLRSNQTYSKLLGVLPQSTWKEFDETITTKKLYVFGASARNKEFFEKYSNKYVVEGILDNSNSKVGKAMFSCPIIKPDIFIGKDTGNMVVLITSTFDISILIQLKEMNIKHIYIYNQLENARILQKI